jgi:hypothetical protein
MSVCGQLHRLNDASITDRSRAVGCNEIVYSLSDQHLVSCPWGIRDNIAPAVQKWERYFARKVGPASSRNALDHRRVGDSAPQGIEPINISGYVKRIIVRDHTENKLGTTDR